MEAASRSTRRLRKGINVVSVARALSLTTAVVTCTALLQTPATAEAAAPERPHRAGDAVTPRSGESLGVLVIPHLRLRLPLREGVSRRDLKLGPGRYPWTWLPGEGATVAIAGHRTTNGGPFRNVPQLKPGDAIYIVMRSRFGGGQFRYRVTGAAVVAPNEGIRLVRDKGYERLVLTTCYPLGSSAKRYAVFARPSRR